MANLQFIKQLSQELLKRMPELEWKLTQLDPYSFKQALPKNVFCSQEPNVKSCVQELKANLQALSLEDHEKSANYLADKVKQKIAILVKIYILQRKKIAKNTNSTSLLTMLSTRQQWLLDKEEEIRTLEQQKAAIEKHLQKIQSTEDTSTILSIQNELGEMEKKLSFARELLLF